MKNNAYGKNIELVFGHTYNESGIGIRGMYMFKQHLRLFFKSKKECGLYLLMLFTTTIGMGFYLSVSSDVFFTFTFLVRCIFYEALIFMVIAYLFLRKSRNSYLDEAIQGISKNRYYYTICSFLCLICLLILYNVFVLMFLLINTIKTGEYHVFIDILKNHYLLNLFLPQVIFLILTTMISTIKNTKISISVFLLLILLMSPYMNDLEWHTQPTFPIDQIIYNIHLPFALFIQHSQWPIDPLYGMQNEPYKVFACIFWVLLFIFFIIIFIIKKQKKHYLIISLILTVLCFGCIYIPQCILRIDNRWNGTNGDYQYYNLEENYRTIYNDESVDYKIVQYDLDINIHFMLNITGKLHLESENAQNDFVLTLYHNYIIQSLESNDEFSYERQGDFIYLNFKKPIQKTDIIITYKGYHNLLYSNMQATQLPGYFPWYPMVGNKNCYFNNAETIFVNHGLNPYNRVEKAMFFVKIDAPYQIICNLENKGGIYEGISDSLTLVGGNTAEHDANKYNIENYFPYSHSPYYSVQEGRIGIEESLDSIQKVFNQIYNIDIDTFENKKIIVFPKTLGRTQTMGGYAEFDDYIIIMENTSLWEKYLEYHLFNQFDLNQMYVELLMYTSISTIESKDDFIKNYIESIEMLISYLNEELDETNQEKKKELEEIMKRIDSDNRKEQEKWLHEMGKLIIGE